MDFTWIAAADSYTILVSLVFILGFVAKQLGLPPLAGFLLGGFIMQAMGIETFPALNTLADLGITLLLFTIGLKLDLRSLARPEIWGVSSLHVLMVVISFTSLISIVSYTGLPLLVDINLQTAVLLGFALSFSSTVFAVKVLEDKGELKSNHGRIAIGILIMQDIFAVVFLTISTGKIPSPWAAVVLIVLIALRPVFNQIIKRVGHGELLVITGFIFAMGGASLFEQVNMKADLGALVMGMILARQARSSEMANALLGFKDLFLIGFFLSIGLTASMSLHVFAIALLLVAILPIKVLIYYWLISMFRLRARTSFLTSLSLANYSEFGLIVGAIGYSQGWLSSDWLGVIAVAMALTFIIASPLNVASHQLFARMDKFITRFQREKRLSRDRIISTGDAEILVFGMGRIGTAAYETLREKHGDIVMGVDNDAVILEKHKAEGRKVILGDATDVEFWENLQLEKVRIILLDMPKPEENLFAFQQLDQNGFKGLVAGTAKYDDQVEMLKQAGLDAAFNIYAEAGAGFANHVTEKLSEQNASL
ncbi:MAG: cation:proton antiporter [Gammaproteobacteria bacterium]|nr:cation:proton antiporter [Gammaproteobacteria bacterium]